MILIKVPKVTYRLTYIFDLIFKQLLKIDYTITIDEAIFEAYQEPKISYGTQPIGNELFFASASLLFENEIYQYSGKSEKIAYK